MSESASNKFEIGREINGPAKTYLENEVLDSLLEALVELTANVWTYHDRCLAMEQVLQELIGDDKGVDIELRIESFTPTDANLAKRKRARDQLVADVFRSFSRVSERAATGGPPKE